MTYPSEEVKSEELATGPEILESGGPFSIELAPFNVKNWYHLYLFGEHYMKSFL